MAHFEFDETDPRQDDSSMPSSGSPRRTIIAGAAWTIPVVATTLSAPLAAASTTPPVRKVVDLAVTRVEWMPQGGPGDLPPAGPDGRPAFNANNGLYYDTDVINYGPDTVVGVRFNISLTTRGHTVDPNSSLRPFVQTGGFSYATSYNQDATNLRTVFAYDNPSLSIAPGQTVTIRSLYWTTGAPGIQDDGAYPYASVGALDPNTTENNPGNNGGQSVNAYDVRT